jgi:uncharacterized membrane protein
MNLKQIFRSFFIHTLFAFYVAGGVNHFVNPQFYLPLIPPYLPYPEWINVLAGVAEILLGIGVLFFRTRVVSARLIVLMLVAFIPSHVYFIQVGSCVEGVLCVSEVVGWIRLLVIHPILIFWAFWVMKNPRIYV